MSAQPVHREDPLDPEVILSRLPEREHDSFLAQYREAVDGAHEPAGYRRLREFLRRWNVRTIVLERALAENPNYYEDLEAEIAGVRNGSIPTVPIEEVFADWPERVAAARARRQT